MPRLQFDPSRHGFHFSNSFTNTVAEVFGRRITTEGLCGGVSLAAFNYYRHGYPVPTHAPSDFGTPDGVPPEGHRLRDYILGQQMGSFASAAGFFFPSWPSTSDSDELRDQYRASLGDFDRIRRAIDRGVFVLLGLRSSKRGNLLGHQVLAYGYDVGPPRVYVYDSNFPDQEMTLEADPATERVVHLDAGGNPSSSASDYGSFFVQLELDPVNADVWTEASRPHYHDIGLREGLWLSDPAGDGLRQPGEALEIAATVRNFGDSRSRVQDLVIWARDPVGNNRDGDLGVQMGSMTLEPGQEVRLNRRFERFGEEPGTYRFGVSYLSEQGHWIDVPALADGSQSQRAVDLVVGADAGTDFGSGGYRGAGTYFIRARHSGKVFDVNIDWFSGQNNGRPVCQVDRNDGDHQKFTIDLLPEGYVRMRARHSGKCLDVEGVSTAPGAGVQQWDCHGGPNQQFAIEPVGDHYRIRARHSGLYLDVAGASLENGARLTQWHWWGGDNQLFQFIATP